MVNSDGLLCDRDPPLSSRDGKERKVKFEESKSVAVLTRSCYGGALSKSEGRDQDQHFGVNLYGRQYA